ncbi:Calcium/calmodulin-dependent/calcium-dependent protein kinase [Penicillium soppii]|jgi:serine/threonine protein kinase|uniref:Calcium/calmodulin-dependent/calcium-dependent protein kinase n=1 Tax=Penicillium soppii TaxID=69789 RepID=UPI00254797AB|nr:Calcium/calmodulin-dependent/calcium-dependent protein kinase [Penicillium soppii]KAJ5852015.1 Calcium/calmodulin-dependent/calcium-dependent protein kinase [Penicillium soppii]
MTETRSSQAGLEDPDQQARGHVSKNTKRDVDRSEESLQPSASNDQPESRPSKSSTKQAPPITDVSEAAATFRQAFPSLYGARTPSNRSSSSSLQALNEDTVVDVRSENGSIGRSPRRTSRQSENELPVYPDQSYASLQSQVHPTWQPPYVAPDPRPRHSYASGVRTAGNTPLSSPGLFSMRYPPRHIGTPSASDDSISTGSSLLHPSHLQPPKETHTAEVDRDTVTGNKVINQYEILEELGRGEHGKVKLGQHVATGQKVAIKIVQRYSTRRRLGKLGNPEDKVKKEVAILKKARHPNVVSLLEVIDDPNRQKVYIVLEYVENGEIVWRKKGLREIVHVDKLRLDREKNGIPDTPAFLEESHQFIRTAQHLRRQRERARERVEAQAADAQQGPIPAWSLEHGAESEDEEDEETGLPIRRSSSRSIAVTDESSPSSALDASVNAVEGTMYGAYSDFPFERRFSNASSSFGYAPSEPEWSAEGDDMAYVPCLTIGETRSAFRDSVLGLEYLHYQGIIHRDIKPANLLVTSSHRVKISDFGVSYLGRPMRDEEEENVGETDATELDDARELSKTVGTPAFYAPELCYTGDDFVETIGSIPKITGAIDVWSLGVTLYGMIFGRLPFVSDDEYSMFQTIVKKEVFIPRKRLVPVVDDACDSNQWNLRNSDELIYEDIDDELYDLLRRLLTKDPVKRITLKEIKHHPWTLHGLPNPRIWIEESDPGFQSKGKRIEVSNEEVTSAVSKVPFIQRVRSNVAKWFTGRSKDKEPRKRTSSTTPSTETLSSASSNSTFGKTSRDSRRSSLRGDEDLFRPLKFGSHGHPLAQSVTASPVDEGDWQSYFDATPASLKLAAAKLPPAPPPTVPQRPGPPRRAKSSMSTAESTKTVKPPNFDVPLTVRPRSGVHSSIIEALNQTNFGSLFSGATRRASRGSRSRRTSPSGETGSLRGEAERTPETSTAEPSIAVSNASAQGQVRTPGLWHDEDNSSTGKLAPIHAHRRNRSSQLEGKSSAESFHLTRDALLRRRRSDIEPSEGGTLRVDYAMYSTESLLLPPINPPTNQCPENTINGLTSTPATISSSSADDFTSGMSQSASHPSIPSVISNASSLSGDGHSCKDKDLHEVPSILRTGETVKPGRSDCPKPSEEDDARYYCDDEDEDSEEEVLMIGKRKPPPKAADPPPSN